MEVNDEYQTFMELLIECYQLSPEVAEKLLRNILNYLQIDWEATERPIQEKKEGDFL